MTKEPFINYANVVIGPAGRIVLAVPDSQLDPDMSIEVQLRIDMSLDFFQGLSHVGSVQATPPAAMQALASVGQVTLIEVGDAGPVRTHKGVNIRSQI